MDPRLAQTLVGEWVRQWSDAHDVSEGTWAKYDSHLRNHILPRFADEGLGAISRIVVKGWVKKLRGSLAEATVVDVVSLLSMILGEAVDEGLIPSNPCRRLRIRSGDPGERPHAGPGDVRTLSGRAGEYYGLLIDTAAYTGMRWGELAGLQWTRTRVDDAEIVVDPNDGALHEVNGRLELGPPKTPASARTVHVPPFLVTRLREHRRRHPDARFVFTGADGGLLRRSNFRRRVWLPALAGNEDLGEKPMLPGFHFHDLRHTHKTWLIEDGIPEVVQHKRLGHKLAGVRGIYSHVTPAMIAQLVAALQQRWERQGGVNPGDLYRPASVVNINCSQSAPTDAEQPADEDRRRAV